MKGVIAIELREQHPEVTPAYHGNKVLQLLFYTASKQQGFNPTRLGHGRRGYLFHMLSLGCMENILKAMPPLIP